MRKNPTIKFLQTTILALSLFAFASCAFGANLHLVSSDGHGNDIYEGDLSTSAGEQVSIDALNALLRDITGHTTYANGSYFCTGNLFLVNPYGFVFGPSAQIQAANIVVSTLSISNADFFEGCKTGKFNFVGQGSYIYNQGRMIPQPGGYVCLLSQAIVNDGKIIADYSRIFLASGEKIRLSLDDKSTIGVEIEKAVASKIFGPEFDADGNVVRDADGNIANTKEFKHAITNTANGVISANGGKVVLTAKSLNDVFDYAINNSGIIEANAANNQNGEIELIAEGAPILNTGTIESNLITINAINTNFLNYGKVIAKGSEQGTGEIRIKAAEILQGGLISAERLIDIEVDGLYTAPEIVLPIGPNPVGPIIVLDPDLPPFTIPEAILPIISGPTVNIKANHIGTYERPVNIAAALTYIYKTAGDINIMDSLGFGTSILLRGPPDGDFSIIYFKDTDLTLEATDGSIYISSDAEVSAYNLSLISKNGIYSTGSIIAVNILTLISNGAISSLGTLKTDILIENGASFYVGGVFIVKSADVENDDGAITYTANTIVSGIITDSGAIIINPGVTIVLSGDTTFNAGTDFILNSSSSIYSASGGIYGLNVNAKNITLSGNIITKGNVTMAATDDYTQTGTIIAGGKVAISGKNVTLNTIYFGGSSLSVAATDALVVNGPIKSAVITFAEGVVTITESHQVTLNPYLHDFWTWDWRFDLSGIPDDADITSAILYKYFGVWGSEDITITHQNLVDDYLSLKDGKLEISSTLVIKYDEENPVNVFNGYGLGSVGSGSISLTANGGISINSNIITAGKVSLTSANSSISGAGKVTANILAASARTGIQLNTAVNSISASVSGVGDIIVVEDDSLILSGVTTADGNVRIKTGSDLIFKSAISAIGHMVSLDVGGAVYDEHDGIDVFADSLELRMVNGIGSRSMTVWGDILETQVNKLAAYNSSTGAINIWNKGSLDIDTVGVTVGVVNDAPKGTGNMFSGNSIRVYASDSDNLGESFFYIGGLLVVNSYNSSLTINQAVQSNGGSIYLSANNQVRQKNNITTSSSGRIFVYSGNAIIMDAGTKTESDTGEINYRSLNSDILLSLIKNNGTIDIQAGNAIIDNNGAANNIKSNDLLLSAKAGIGSTDALEVQVLNLQATNITSGDIVIFCNNSNLVLKDIAGFGYSVSNSGGNVNIHTNSSPSLPYSLTVNAKVIAKNDVSLYAEGAGNLVVNADIRSLQGDVCLSSNDDIVINSGVISAANRIFIGNYLFLLGIPGGVFPSVGNIIQNGGQIGSGSEKIYLAANDDITLVNVKGNTVWIWSDAGKVTGSGITANALVVNAATGIDLKTFVSRLQAYNKTSGDIKIENTNKLEITDLSSLAYMPYLVFTHNGAENLAGGINISASSPLTVNADVIANGSIVLSAGETNDTGLDDLVINANITSLNGNITLLAGDDIIQNSGTTIQAKGLSASIYLFAANNDMDGIGGIIQGGSIVTNNGIVRLSGKQDIFVNSINAGSATIDITSSYGSINEYGADAGADLIAKVLILSAANGIGSGNYIETQVTNLQALNTNSGNIQIVNNGTLYIYGTGVVNKAAGGVVVLTANSSIYITLARIYSMGDIILTATGTEGDIVTGGYLWPAIESYYGNVVMNASRDIILGKNGYGDVYTRDYFGKYLLSNTGIGSIRLTAGRDIIVDNNSWVYSDSGDIVFIAGNDIKVINTAVVNSKSGKILFTSGHNILSDAYSPISSITGEINFSAKNDIIIGSISTGGNVTLIADSDASGVGAIVDNNGNAVNIIANTLTLSAATGIGSGNALETQVSNLQAFNSTSANIEIKNTGDLIIMGTGVVNNAPDGNIVIDNSGKLSVNSAITANGGDITLTGANIIIKANIQSIATFAGNGSVTITINSGGSIQVINSAIIAQAITGNASVILKAVNDIVIDPSNITATVTGNGNALITINSTTGDVQILGAALLDRSKITAQVSGTGTAIIDIDAGGNITITTSDLLARANTPSAQILLTAAKAVSITQSYLVVVATNGASLIRIDAITGNVNLTSSALCALTSSTGSAEIYINAGDSVNITSADILATCGTGFSGVSLTAKNNVNINNTNFIRAIIGNGSAFIDITATNGTISVINSEIYAYAFNTTASSVTIAMNAGMGININNSKIRISIDRDGDALILITAANGDIDITNGSVINATLGRNGTADIMITADNGSVTVRRSTLTASTTGNGGALVHVYSNHAKLTISNSVITATVSGNGGTNINIYGVNTRIVNTNINGTVIGNGTSTIYIESGKKIRMVNSSVVASTSDGKASIIINAIGAIKIRNCNISALVKGDGDAGINIASKFSTVTIKDTKADVSYSITATVNGDGNAIILISTRGKDISISNYEVRSVVNGDGIAITAIDTLNWAYIIDKLPTDMTTLMTLLSDLYKAWDSGKGTITITDSNISSYSRDIALTAVMGGDIVNNGVVSATSTDGYAFVAMIANGDIKAGLLTAMGGADEYSAILIASLFGNITLGDVTAHYLALVAAHDIGTVDAPIQTNVDILSAYSWDSGDIYINEANDIELGLYVPIYYGASLVGALGVSVAANDGIIHIVADDNIIVNSVISPRGGVYLESVTGSIYAGHGWLPSVSQSNLDSLFGGSYVQSIIEEALMGLSGTEWQSIGGVDYFSPAMISIGSDLPTGPNVIAGGYSYFAAPEGTIGVGTLGGVPSVTNPLKVNIQVVAGSQSAVPDGFTPSAGLTLLVGGEAGTYDTGNGNGVLPINAVIEGIVRPGTTAITGLYPSVGLDLSILPTGYVLYNDTDLNIGTTAMFAPSAVNSGVLGQVWPALPNSMNYIWLIEELSRGRENAIYEIMQHFRDLTNANPRVPFFYFYHPLTPTDLSAFDNIKLDVGAYEFIDNSLDLKKRPASFYGV